MKNNLLYIGLNGYAGSGKDTVAKILQHILSKKNSWKDLEHCKKYYKPNNPKNFATFNDDKDLKSSKVTCIAFADQLKKICATMFGIPVDRFYYNKGNAWICINKDFEYTETKPMSNYIISAEDYYTGISNYTNSNERYWMSLREILVYVGTYVGQRSINKQIFVNIVNNTINTLAKQNQDLEYVIVTDVRFLHELDFITNHNGITINIERDSVNVLNNIAEHDLDDNEDFDFVIDNNGTYDDLFEQVWNLVYDNPIFLNKTIELDSRDNTNNYLRLVEHHDKYDTYHLCTEYDVIGVKHVNGDIIMIDPSGGPAIYVDQTIYGAKSKIPLKIYQIENKCGFFIDMKK